ncbi:hypothetical protein AQ14_587 [Francisella tularensis subsp. novicida D9876]|uniref:hypothetical protein n=1 Tax=Francisella tularensis TaxID=263 RepID=UPI000303D1E2|nr:hypothetical protein [Francisella tularensis]AJI73645.1 hypothetical protein AQ14_587 [Francisella tularensis subsp. novicida D9876]
MWAAIITGIFTLLGAYVANRANLKRYELEQRERDLKLKLEKLEEFYTILGEFEYLVIVKKNEGDVASDEIQTGFASATKMEVMIAIYFEDLEESFKNKIRSIVNKSKLVDIYTSSRNIAEFKKDIGEYSRNLLNVKIEPKCILATLIKGIMECIRKLK